MTQTPGPPAQGKAGNGKTPDRRSGVDRRICDLPAYAGPERRRGPRRKPERLPDKPIKR
ncbi:MAG TPA: hypothetical protein VFG76_06155 [Candidatus Polarisedimenticolia bacterium]|nr:hypothetical protein [Candidatus Polarisedimenticolia bacterium]